MSEKLKVLSGKEVIKIFERYGFEVSRTVGSHVRLKFQKEFLEMHVTIPLHKELKRGTLRGIAKDFESCFGYEKCREEFYSK